MSNDSTVTTGYLIDLHTGMATLHPSIAHCSRTLGISNSTLRCIATGYTRPHDIAYIALGAFLSRYPSASRDQMGKVYQLDVTSCRKFVEQHYRSLCRGIADRGRLNGNQKTFHTYDRLARGVTSAHVGRVKVPRPSRRNRAESDTEATDVPHVLSSREKSAAVTSQGDGTTAVKANSKIAVDTSRRNIGMSRQQVDASSKSTLGSRLNAIIVSDSEDDERVEPPEARLHRPRSRQSAAQASARHHGQGERLVKQEAHGDDDDLLLDPRAKVEANGAGVQATAGEHAPAPRQTASAEVDRTAPGSVSEDVICLPRLYRRGLAAIGYTTTQSLRDADVQPDDEEELLALARCIKNEQQQTEAEDLDLVEKFVIQRKLLKKAQRDRQRAQAD